MTDQPYLAPLTGAPAHMHDPNAAAEVASREEMARNAALYSRPQVARPVLPPIKTAELPPDFAQQVAALDEEIFARGIAVNTERILSLGRERFKKLLELDRAARSWQKIADFTRFESVQNGLAAFDSSYVPQRKTAEQAAGDGKEKDQVRAIRDWNDLWKCTSEKQELIDDIYRFHDAFESLQFGHEMLERLQADGHARSRFFCGGKRRESDYLTDWLSAVDGPLSRVTLSQPLWIVAWLADETAEAPTTVSLAQDLFNARAPTEKQLQLAQAILDAFLLDYDGWHLWQSVGRATRSVREMSTLAAWRARLAKRFSKIAQFHTATRAPFFSVHGYGSEYHSRFEPAQHRAFLDQLTQSLLDQAAAVCALAIEASFPGSVIARFQRQILCAGKPKHRAEIAARLAAFPGSNCQLEISEVQS